MSDDKQIIFSMVRVSRIFPPKREVIKDISLSFFYGAKIGVIGANGTGKSTLLKIIAGLDVEHSGQVSISKGYSVGYLSQEPKLDPLKTVKEIVQEGAGEISRLLKEYEDVNNRLAEPLAADEMEKILNRQGELQEKIEAAGGWELDNKLEVAMDALRCPPADQTAGTLSGGEKRRVALCRLLLEEPDILLLDEPTNHLAAESVEWLEQHLQKYEGTVIAVTHDRYFLDHVAGWILELEGGYGVPWKGNYSSWLEQKKAVLSKKEKGESERQKSLSRELDWIKMAPRERQTAIKARLAAYDELFGQSQDIAQKDLEIYIPPGPRLGDRVVEAQDLSKSFGDKLLFAGLNFSLPPGGIVGVIGPNGAGKTTLFKLLTGLEKADSGNLKTGESVRLAYADQEREALLADKTVWESVSGGQDEIQLGKRAVNSRAYVSRFNFSGQDQQKKVGVLSGGERNRLHMALMFKQGANLLLLDEPTNDLDVDTLRALEEALLHFAGCCVVISHDRWFLDRIATHILAFEGESRAAWFEGNYSEYESDRKKRLGADAQTPHRIRYKKLTRN